MKHLVGSKKVRTFASAFEQNREQVTRKSSLKDLHKQRSSTRSELHYLYSVIRVKDTNRQFEKIESLL